MNKTNKSSAFPSPLHIPLGNLVTHLHAVTHIPSYVGIPFSTTQSLQRPLPWQGFLASEGPKTKAYPYLKTIIPAITCSWQSMDTIGYQCPIMALLLKWFTNILLHVPILFTATNSLAANSNHRNWAFSMLSCTKHIVSIRSKRNWNKFKSHLIGSFLIRCTCNSVYFLSQQVKIVVWSNHHV